MEAGKKRLSGDTARQATSGEVTSLKAEARDLKEVVAEQTLELRLLKKACSSMGAIRNEVSCIRKAGNHQACRGIAPASQTDT